MPYISPRIAFTLPLSAENALCEEVDPLRRRGMRDFIAIVGTDSAQRLQDGYTTRRRIKQLMPTSRKWIVDRWIEDATQCAILEQVGQGVWRIVNFSTKNFTRAQHAAWMARHGHPPQDYFELLAPAKLPANDGSCDIGICSRARTTAQEVQNPPRTEYSLQKKHMSGARAPGMPESHTRTAQRTTPPPVDAKLQQELEDAADAVAGLSSSPTKSSTQVSGVPISISTPVALCDPPPPIQSLRAMVPPAAADFLFGKRSKDTGRAEIGPHRLADTSDPNEHDVAAAVRAIMPDAMPGDALDALWRELRRANVCRSELSLAVKAAQKIPKDQPGRLAGAFGALRNQRRRQEQAGQGCRGPLPEVRHIPRCGRMGPLIRDAANVSRETS